MLWHKCQCYIYMYRQVQLVYLPQIYTHVSFCTLSTTQNAFNVHKT